MQLGIRYRGWTSCKRSWAWLSNVINKEAALQICTSGAPLHQQGLAELLEMHFPEEMQGGSEQTGDDDE